MKAVNVVTTLERSALRFELISGVLSLCAGGAAPQRLNASDRIEYGPHLFNLLWPPATFNTSNTVGIKQTL